MVKNKIIVVHANRHGEIIDIDSPENQEKLTKAVFDAIDKYVEILMKSNT